jgi:hypothetical protein
VAIQPEPDSQSALLRYLGFLFGMAMGRDYQNKQVPIGSASSSVLSGEAVIALARGLHESFDFSCFFGPFALSGLCTTRCTIPRHARRHQALINAFEKACQ